MIVSIPASSVLSLRRLNSVSLGLIGFRSGFFVRPC